MRSRDRPVVEQETITWGEASALPLCLLDRRMRHRQLIDAAFAAAGVVPRPRVETDAVLSVLSHVRFEARRRQGIPLWQMAQERFERAFGRAEAARLRRTLLGIALDTRLA
jgi:hypothetical protein